MRNAIAILALLLASCTVFSIVEPGQVTVKDRMTVTVPKPWNRYGSLTSSLSEMWTADGLPLDNLWFYAGVPDGETLRRTHASSDKRLPKFQAAMTPVEVVEMVEGYATLDGSTFRLERLSALTLAGGPGFRFDFRTLRKGDEVELRGTGFGTIRDGKLYMVLFTAPATFYFAKSVAQVESIAGSMTIRK
jgi:glutamine cyclotransferase